MVAAMEPQDNRYAPPKALELELPPEAPADRCEHVEWACKLMWIGFGVSILSSLLVLVTHAMPHPGIQLFMELVGTAIGLAILYWVTTKLRAGRNWMRLLITIVNVVGIAILAIGLVWLLSTEFGKGFLSGFFGAAPVQSVSMLLQYVLGTTEAVLINTPSSRAWFQAKKYSA